MRKLLLPLSLLLALLSFQSCKDKNEDDPNAALKTSIKNTYADIVYANYDDAYTTAKALQTAVNTFVNSPTSANLIAAQNAWKAAREPYGQSEAYRFASGPIDDADGPEGALNAWPLDEIHIDNIIAGSEAITVAYLESKNESPGEKDISIGYHAIEYLLWDGDNTDPVDNKPGQRDFNYFVGNGSTATRAREYLKVTTDLLVVTLETLRDEWSGSGTGNYRSTFLALDNNVALKNILTGIGVLSKSELAGERIAAALVNHDQEDEHSCFSDNTHRDIRLNTYGVKNVYIGSYTKVGGGTVSGPSLQELVNKVDAALGAAVTAQLNAAVTAVDDTGIPFDYAISSANPSGNAKVQASVDALQALGDKFAEASQKLGIPISTELPE